jgi:hypothetical protein
LHSRLQGLGCFASRADASDFSLLLLLLLPPPPPLLPVALLLFLMT